ncbi:hypothetical protein AN958_03598 [Leucoagaricus sp. SymC.cos]|nr:hypothetical protein AN958_03598 [Leucoagaricus sp. SymC.cos]
MDAAQLARWTRFAVKGGIGRCTGVNNCIAQTSEDLMVMGDEIVVLMRIPDTEDVYLGFCEGVIGRFHGQDVRFHGKVKKSIVTKRSSVSVAKTPSPSVDHSTPSPSRTNSLSAKDADENQSLPPTRSPLVSKKTTHAPTLPSTDDEALSPPSMRRLTETGHLDGLLARILGVLGIYIFLVSAPVISPLNIVKKSPMSSPLQTMFNAIAQEDLVETSTMTNPGDHDDDTVMSDVRLRVPGDGNDSDGEMGIGLSLLQSLGGDSDEESFVQRESIQYDEERAVEGLLYGEPEEAEASPPNIVQIRPPTPQPATTNVPHTPPHAQDDSSHSHLQTVTLPSRSSSPHSPASPKSSASLSPPPNHQHFSLSSCRLSVQSQTKEGAGDIYDDYRYSRASMLSGSTIGMMSRGRSSVGSRVSARDWDSHVHDQPPPLLQPPIPDSRPGIDLVFASSEVSASVNEALRKSLTASSTTSPKSTESSTGPSERSERESTRLSRLELLFPQPPTGVHLQHDMVLDQATRESLRRSSEASRILRPADFRLSVDSEVSIYSSSPIDEHHDDTTVSAHPLSDSPVQEETGESSSKHLRPALLELASQQRQSRSPLSHTKWATPISSPSDPTFASTASATPTMSLFMPTALTLFTSGMASALRQKVVINRSSGPSDGVSGREEEVGKKEGEGVEGGEDDEVLRDIVVEDKEDIPSGVAQETTFETEYAHDVVDTTFDTSNGTIILPDNDGPPSPLIPSGPPLASPLSPTSPTTSPTSPTSPSSPTTTSTSSPTHLRSTQRVTTLADLREGGGVMIPGTNQRRSLFLPHLKAPKPPQMETMGPMFIRRSMYQQSSTTDSPLSPLQNLFVATTQEDMAPVTPVLSPPPLPPLQKRSLLEVMHMAMNGVTSAAMRPRLLVNGGLTIYGCLEVELSENIGPVPILFSVEPPPPRQVVPPQQQQHGGPPPPQFVVQPPPMTTAWPGVIERSRLGGSGSLGPGGGGGGSVPPSPRSATSSPALGGSAAGGVSDGEGSNASSTSGGVIPRANFFPKKPGVRPRSTGFLSFHPHMTQIEVLLPVSREDGAPALIGTPSVNDVRASLQSLRTNSRSSVRSSAHEADDAQLRSQANPPPMSTLPPIHSASHRQPSLRTKLSLPNLRRNHSKNDEALTTATVPLISPVKDHSYNASASTAQDLDFELVWPMLQFQQSRASEDSGVL